MTLAITLLGFSFSGREALIVPLIIIALVIAVWWWVTRPLR